MLAAEYLLRLVPIGTHDWEKFISPEDLQFLLDKCKAFYDQKNIVYMYTYFKIIVTRNTEKTPTKLDICKHMILIIDSITYTCKWISKLNSVHVPYMKYSLGEGG